MPFQIPDTTIRSALTADLKAAWSIGSPAVSILKDIHYGPPPPGTDIISKDILPRAFIYLRNPDIRDYNEGTATFGERDVWFEYSLTLQELWPTTPGSTIDEFKVARANSLLSVLTDADRYAGIGLLDIREILFDDSRVTEEAEPYFDLTMILAIEAPQVLF